MMAFITRCWRNARLDWLGLLLGACVLYGPGEPAWAQTPATEVSQLRVERTGDSLYLSAAVKFDLPPSVEDALLKGIPVIFVAEADIFRERWYWANKKMVGAERHMRLAYQPLTRRWRLNVANGPIAISGTGLALNQSFDTLVEAMAVVQRLAQWKIAEVSELDFEQRHLLEFRFRLDVSQLPRPLQIGTLGQSDWNLAVSTSQTLTIEGGK